MEDESSKKSKRKKAKKVNLLIFGLAMFLLGVFVLAAFRFATFKSDDVHYHANFALYVNGKQDQFKNFTFYEEVAECSVHDASNIKSRAHMHNETPGLAHIEANGVTWGQFFTNLGYTLGNKVVATDGGVYADGQDGNKLRFVLNGKTIQSVEGRLIGNEDVLLVDYGKDDQKSLQLRYDSIPRNAHKANSEKDPSTCSGSGNESSLAERLKAAVGL